MEELDTSLNILFQNVKRVFFSKKGKAKGRPVTSFG
jgi:hypothetical protein